MMIVMIYTHTHTNTYTCTHTQTKTYTHTHTHSHPYTHTCRGFARQLITAASLEDVELHCDTVGRADGSHSPRL
jgi:hypothetical protein